MAKTNVVFLQKHNKPVLINNKNKGPIINKKNFSTKLRNTYLI